MEKNEKDSDCVLAFDTLFTTNSIQVLKILLPCIPVRMQQFLAVFIKYLELQYTMQYFKTHTGSYGGRQMENQVQDFSSIFPKIQGYLSPSERTHIEQIFNMLQTFQTIQEMKPMLDALNSFSGTNGGTDTNGNPMDFLKTMLTPEQQSMFEMFSST